MKGIPRKAELLPRALALSAEGRIAREIAAELGVARSTISSWLSDPDRSKALRRRESYRGVCEACGAPTDGSAGPGLAPTLCAKCSLGVLIDSTVAASHALCEEVVALWASGISVREMAATIGWKTNSLNAAIVKWRRQGWDLPYRNQRSNAGRLRQRQAGREAARHLHPEVMPDVI